MNNPSVSSIFLVYLMFCLLNYIIRSISFQVSCDGPVAPTLLQLTRDGQKFTDDKCDSELAEGVDAHAP